MRILKVINTENTGKGCTFKYVIVVGEKKNLVPILLVIFQMVI